ncbi:MAG TPA: holo-[acyl-carrier-protein] synthase [Deltaproteobacteria bacterium]|nr:holo-[acyl-carrier-protein] synthase [Deltaproteobacteria bacterium]
MRTGIDIVEISRIEKLVTRYDRRFLEKVFTGSEIAYAHRRRRPAEPLAGRFAAKEAFMKAMGRKLPWTDVEITMEGTKPSVSYDGRVYSSVSISHEREYAVAVVVLIGQEGP